VNDLYYHCPVLDVSTSLTHQEDEDNHVYRVIFGYAPTSDEENKLYPIHGSELPLIFHSKYWKGDSGEHRALKERDEALSEKYDLLSIFHVSRVLCSLINHLVNFIKTGDANEDGLFQWATLKPWVGINQLTFLTIQGNMASGHSFKSAECDFWSNLYSTE